MPLPVASGSPARLYVGLFYIVPGVPKFVQSISTRTATLATAVAVWDVGVVLLLPLTWVFVYRPVTNDGDTNNVLLVDAFSDAFITVIH